MLCIVFQFFLFFTLREDDDHDDNYYVSNLVNLLDAGYFLLTLTLYLYFEKLHFIGGSQSRWEIAFQTGTMRNFIAFFNYFNGGSCYD